MGRPFLATCIFPTCRSIGRPLAPHSAEAREAMTIGITRRTHKRSPDAADPLALPRQSSRCPRAPIVGARSETAVSVPRLDEAADIDGSLDEPVWTQAAVLTGFSQYEPVDQRPASDTTQVLVWYSPTGIYFSIKAFDASGSVNAMLADRDKIDGDDHVQLLLDTFDDQRPAPSSFLGTEPRWRIPMYSNSVI